ncbi:hypothetical protein LTR09_008651 [Extremus antarcticus]|uniref:Uncharacterized protein n=1 Tax=Extremus antarcticus TaxID=702011 RepID=A0AAJ0DAA6_9PEZI|nr:hypothetical protein LTR09_008651 [Extremus antarcticus]
MSGSSSWNDSGFAFAPNTNTMDAQTMPSDKAQAARERAAEIIEASKNGKPGEADAMMGKREPQGNRGIIPLDWLATKFKSEKKEKKEKRDEKVIR